MLSAATWMNLEMIILNEGSQTEKEKYTGYCSYAESKKKKKDTNELIHKTEADSQTQKTNLQLQKEKGEGGWRDKVGIWN